jgi:hypothetical protein
MMPTMPKSPSVCGSVFCDWFGQSVALLIRQGVYSILPS